MLSTSRNAGSRRGPRTSRWPGSTASAIALLLSLAAERSGARPGGLKRTAEFAALMRQLRPIVPIPGLSTDRASGAVGATHSDSSSDCASRRASASTASMSSSAAGGADQARARSAASRQSRDACARYRRKPIRRSRKASTATSLAALRTAGAVPPALQRLARQPQRRKARLVGRLEGQACRARRDRAARVGVAMRRGQASASAIGVRMSGDDSCASTEPSA